MQRYTIKLDTLTKINPKQHNMQKTTQFQLRVINLSDKHFTKEQINILSLGPKHAIEKEPKKERKKKQSNAQHHKGHHVHLLQVLLPLHRN